MELAAAKQQVLSLAQAGRFAEANRLCTELCNIHVNDAEAWFLLAAINGHLGKFAEAEKYSGNAARLAPGNPVAHYNLAFARHRQEKLAEAEQAYNRALELNPGFAEAHHDLANLLAETGRHQQAITHYRHAIKANPSFAHAYYNLGRALELDNQADEAMECYRQATRLLPNFAEAWFRLGNVLSAAGSLDSAVDAFRAAITADNRHADAFNNLGNALKELGKPKEAIDALQKALALKGDSPEVIFNLAIALQANGQLQEAESTYKKALAGKPIPQAANNLGNLLVIQGRVEEAEAYYRQAIAFDPAYAEAHSNLLFCLNYKTGTALDSVYQEHRQWEALHAGNAAKLTFSNVPDPDRVIVIGYLSPDFCEHSVAYFIEALLASHDRRHFRIVCYAEVKRPDKTTERLQKLADAWYLTRDFHDEELVQQIRQDRIDILVDLAGHTQGNRLTVLSRKPAPVQISYIGYPNTTGLSSVDYRITDVLADPADSREKYSEKLLRIPGSFLCYTPPAPEDPIDVSTLPALSNGYITFGSFNNLAKLNGATVRVWSELLESVPGSRLILKNKALVDSRIHQQYTRMFRAEGIDEDRLELISWTPSTREHFLLYNRIDIALDTFPYNGATTTCEALWMGVPVVTLTGDRHASRVGTSLLCNAGLPELVTTTTTEYRHVASRLASEIPRLAELRSGLRERLLASPLCDSGEYCIRVERLFRQAWMDWCRGITNNIND